MSHWPVFKLQLTVSFSILSRFLTVIILSVHVSQLHEHDRTVYTLPVYKILASVFPYFSTNDKNVC